MSARTYPHRSSLEKAPELEIVQRAQRGDDRAFNILVERYERRAMWRAYQILRNEGDARDAVQETFFKVFQALPRVRVPASADLWPWIKRIVINTALDLRERELMRQAEPLAANMSGGSVSLPDMIARLEEQQDVKDMLAGLGALPRQVLLLKHGFGLKYGEISTLTGVPVGTLRSHEHRARARIVREVCARNIRE